MRVVLLLSLLAIAGADRPTAGAEPDPAIAPLLATGRDADLRWPDISDVQGDLTGLYQSRNWSPLWFAGDTLSGPARALIRVLRQAGNRGLDPADYDAEWLAGEAAEGGATRTGDWRARVDVALSVAAARFATALARGRVSPTAVHAQFALPRGPFSVDSTLAALARTEHPNELLRSLEPPFLHYWLLMAALNRYRALAAHFTLTALPPMPRRLHPGEPWQGVAALRSLLTLLGDEPDSLAPPQPDTLYAGEIVEAVRRFQVRQGFAPDGVIGDSTRARLDHPFEPRIRQMELTLERWRWMPRRFNAPPIVVNIPAYRLYAFTTMDSRESTLLRMNVVVGQAYRNETPVFAADMTYLVFSPYWDVPPSIAVKEIEPEAEADSGFLAENRYELIQDGEVVPASPENVGRIGEGVRVRQKPGPYNALGGVKFMLPNDNSVYLHDTPSREAFARSRRDASHGCIRLGDAFGLARFVLRDQPEWTDERIRAAMHADEPLRVDLSHPIPVFIVYATAIARENGDVYFYADVYRHDRTLDRLLRRGYPYPVAPPPDSTTMRAEPAR